MSNTQVTQLAKPVLDCNSFCFREPSEFASAPDVTSLIEPTDKDEKEPIRMETIGEVGDCEKVVDLERVIQAKRDPPGIVHSYTWEEEKMDEEEMDEEEKLEKEEKYGEKIDENCVSFSLEDLLYDNATGQLFIHLESGVAEVNDPNTRNQLLAKMSSAQDNDLLAGTHSESGAKAAPVLSQVQEGGQDPPWVNFRHRERRLTLNHMESNKVKSLGRPTSWTKDLLMSTLEAAFNKPRFGILWSEFGLEEKVACFDSVDWAASYPLDLPPRHLMFERGKDEWSNWA